ncbi:hypothetical protein [Brevibacillus laterosporus]|uniref:hypothetical protein n=1 Tax=Brevibacillus laterosporus TaxID=1465 RepID=UPI0021573391|nr:hypothetical protein [Brevibacillus laterosporus]MED1663403.1 hypothetical protein [Brevibacillus laterosporus]MED1668673.1 hypothetical protein [Brevibacillus laterosporus]MED1717464.1 hypothetical protein [Brevibacillus laterosporus]
MHTHTPNHSTEKIDHLYRLIEENKEPLYRIAYSFVKKKMKLSVPLVGLIMESDDCHFY